MINDEFCFKCFNTSEEAWKLTRLAFRLANQYINHYQILSFNKNIAIRFQWQPWVKNGLLNLGLYFYGFRDGHMNIHNTHIETDDINVTVISKVVGEWDISPSWLSWRRAVAPISSAPDLSSLHSLPRSGSGGSCELSPRSATDQNKIWE